MAIGTNGHRNSRITPTMAVLSTDCCEHYEDEDIVNDAYMKTQSQYGKILCEPGVQEKANPCGNLLKNPTLKAQEPMGREEV